MTDKTQISFRISALTPDSLPMKRLAEYLSFLAVMYGNDNEVHFKGVRKGSAVLVAEAFSDVVDGIEQRLRLINTSETDDKAQRAYNDVNRLLQEDHSTAYVARPKFGKIITFPGAKQQRGRDPISVVQPVTIDGVVIRIGGRDETIPVVVQDMEGNNISCTIKGKQNAKELSKYYLGDTIRITGIGRLTRGEDGIWKMSDVVINSYYPISNEPLDKIFSDLRSIEGNGWKSLDNPIATWKKIRGS